MSENEDKFYHQVPEFWRRSKKLDLLTRGHVKWTKLEPDARYNGHSGEYADELGRTVQLSDLFAQKTLGLNTDRDAVVYDFDRHASASAFIADYDPEVDRHRHDKKADLPQRLKWNSRLRRCLARGQYAAYNDTKVREAMYRPFNKKVVFFDNVLNQRTGKWSAIHRRMR